MHRLLFGDNLKWLQDTKVFPDASVDLVYLDPPLNSNAHDNVLFKEAGSGFLQTFEAAGDRGDFTATTGFEFDCPSRQRWPVPARMRAVKLTVLPPRNLRFNFAD